MEINGKEYTFTEVSVKAYTVQPPVIEIYYDVVDLATGARDNKIVRIYGEEAITTFGGLGLMARLDARLYADLGVTP